MRTDVNHCVLGKGRIGGSTYSGVVCLHLDDYVAERGDNMGIASHRVVVARGRAVPDTTAFFQYIEVMTVHVKGVSKRGKVCEIE